MTSFTQVFGGGVIQPSQLYYALLELTANVELEWPLETAPSDVPVMANQIDVDGDAPDWEVALPNATNGSTGAAVLFNNVGAEDVVITNNAGGVLGTVASGEAWYFFLADNTTIAGVWRTFQFGAGTSAANAAALAGAGLKAITTTLNLKILPEDEAATPYVVLNADRAKCKQWTGGVGAFTLPDPATVGADWFVWVKNSGTGTLTLNPSAGNIDGNTSKTIAVGGSCVIVSDGTNWLSLADGSATTGNFNFITINVAGTGTYTLSGSELNRVAYKFTGVLTGDRPIEIPATVQQYWVNNATTGAFTLTVRTSGGTGIVVPQNASLLLYCDGTDAVTAVSAVKQVAGLRTLDADGTFVIGDAGLIISHTAAIARTYTIPANATVPYPIGTMIDLDNRAAAILLAVAAAGGVTIDGGAFLLGPGQRARIVKVAINTWIPIMSAQPRLACYARRLSQTITNNTATDVSFSDTDLIDMGGWHDNGGTPTIFTVPAGVTVVFAQALLNWISVDETDIFRVDASILKNAGSVNIEAEQRGMVFGDDGSSFAGWLTNIGGLINVVAGDQIKCRITCASTPGAGDKLLEAYFSIWAL